MTGGHALHMDVNMNLENLKTFRECVESAWLKQISKMEDRSEFLYDCSLNEWEEDETIDDLLPEINENRVKFPCVVSKKINGKEITERVFLCVPDFI